MIPGTCEPLNDWQECWDVPAYPRHTYFSEHHSNSSNPTTSTGVDRYQTGTCITPVFCRPSATRKTTRFGLRDAKCNAAIRHAPSCMGATELQSNWPDMRKTLGKPGFCSKGFRKLTERTGTELLGVFPKVSGEFERQSPWNRRYRSGTWII